MTEKITRERVSNMNKPVPMKLFAAWEVEKRTPPNCIPRLCSLTITRLSLLTPLPSDLSSLSLAVKMQSSKRTLRSHEIPVPQSILSAGTTQTTNAFGTAVGTGGGIVSGGCGMLNSPPLLETELDLHFSLQYPHFIKRDGNRRWPEGVIKMDAVLQKSMDMTVELTASGKSGRQGMTIATLRAERVASIPVDQDNKNNNSVLLTDRVNEYSDEDEENEFSSGEQDDDGTDAGLTGYDAKRGYAAKHDLRKYRKLERSENDGDDGALCTNPVDSDSEFENLKDKGSRAKISRQRNFKQKIVALLKRFKVPEELDGSVARAGGALRAGERELDALFQELESLSCEGDDSGPDMDSLSIGSTPKPSLRPFFTNSRNMLHDNLIGVKEKKILEKRNSLVDKKSTSTTPDKASDWKNDSSGNEDRTGNTDPEAQSDPQNTGSPPRENREKDPPTLTERRNKLFRASSSTPSNVGKKKQSLSLSAEPKSVLESCLSPTNVEPRKSLLDQVTRTFSTEESVLPDVLTIVGPPEPHSGLLSQRLAPLLAAAFRPIFQPHNTAEVKAVLQALMNKIQKYCNTTAKPPTTIKVLLLGGDWLEGAVLRHYVDLLGVKPPDWVNHLRFYIVPIGSSLVSRYLCGLDSAYGQLFGVDSWQQHCERAASLDPADILEVTNRIQIYLHTAGPCTQIPIAEAMVNYKDEDSCQVFVPFISDVKIGCSDSHQLSLDLDESLSNVQQQQQQSSGNLLSSSPPSGRISPPMPTTPQLISNQEPLELQIDYWPIMKPGDKEKSQNKSSEQSKNSIKSTFRNLQVYRLPLYPQASDASHGLIVSYATKEKKQKIMRLGKKKEKDRELEKQCIDGIARLICSPKQSHPVPLRVYIDGTEWTGVKFFQLSSQWQTHVRNFPVGLIGNAPSDLT
ncbi:hypothetical protein HA402_010627 [Bradysia odoriphaga]|nr:hypothetical protein HA402_010627 [Bradysia odoriphaga]